MRLLDLFCKAGGCSVGYHRAGFEVEGVDIELQPDYPYKFYQMDAMEFLKTKDLSKYDVIHASPPCQAYSTMCASHRFNGKEYPDFLEVTRQALKDAGKPYIIENVMAAPVVNYIVLCGTMFDLDVLRHRKFESNMFIWVPGECNHKGKIKYKRKDNGIYYSPVGNNIGTLEEWGNAMGIDWMTTREELSHAIPPAYTEWIGQQLIQQLERAKVS